MVLRHNLLKCWLCGFEQEFSPNDYFCPHCRQPMLFDTSIPKEVSGTGRPTASLKEFIEFLPLKNYQSRLSLGEGRTPLIPLKLSDSRISLLAKLEANNPTLSFKDRGSAVVMQKITELGWKKVGTVSTGNMASSTAAYAARAGLQAVLLVKKGTSPAALLSSAVFRPVIIEVDGDYGQLFWKSLEVGKKLEIYFANSVDPLRIEGYKLTAFEICQELKRAPDFVFVPVSSGGHFVGLFKGFYEMKQAGFTDRLPVMVGVQAEGCSPLAKAFEAGEKSFSRIKEAGTIAHSIANPDPPAGNLVLHLSGEYKGWLTSVTDEEMMEAQGKLAEAEGLFVQPESASTLAAFQKLRSRISGTVVLIMTGQGLKAAHQPSPTGLNYFRSNLEEIDKVLKSIFEK